MAFARFLFRGVVYVCIYVLQCLCQCVCVCLSVSLSGSLSLSQRCIYVYGVRACACDSEKLSGHCPLAQTLMRKQITLLQVTKLTYWQSVWGKTW
jgi:hypothetical protein